MHGSKTKLTESKIGEQAQVIHKDHSDMTVHMSLFLFLFIGLKHHYC